MNSRTPYVPVMIDREKLKQAILNICKTPLKPCLREEFSHSVVMPLSGRFFLKSTTPVRAFQRGWTLLQPFRSTKPLSSGLGLPIVSQIIAAHNGTVDYVSHSGKGTTFKIGFPAVGSLVEIRTGLNGVAITRPRWYKQAQIKRRGDF